VAFCIGDIFIASRSRATEQRRLARDMASHGALALGAPAALAGARGAPTRRVRVDAVRGSVAPVRFSSATENRARRPIRVVRRASSEDDDDASAFDVSEGTVWKRKKKKSDDAATGDAVTGTRGGASEGRETSPGPSESRSADAIDVDALSSAGANVVAAGSASVVALALGSAAVGVTEALESVPLLQGFEEAVGLAVSAYYANKLGGAFITASGREAFRLRLVENFTRVTGSGSAPLAIAGALARTDEELDAQISGLIGDLLKKTSATGDADDAPENVKRAVARFVKERDGETRNEIEALRVANEAMRAEVDAIEMLQTDLMDARRETSEARANVRVMNMEDKERARLEAEARKARAEGAAFADAMRAEMASMAADAATAAVEAEKALLEERRLREEAEEKARAGAEVAAAASAAPPEADASAAAAAAAAAEAAAAASLAASRREIADLKRQLAEAAHVDRRGHRGHREQQGEGVAQGSGGGGASSRARSRRRDSRFARLDPGGAPQGEGGGRGCARGGCFVGR
jgi:hypothetical protein